MKFSNLLLATVVAVSTSTSVASIDNGLVARQIAEPQSLLRGLKTVKDKEGKDVEVPDDAPAAEPAPVEPAPKPKDPEVAESAPAEPAPEEPAPETDEAGK